MSLSEQVQIARRFQRAVRIDADFGDLGALDGYLCPRSSADVLLLMARHIAETGHAAFTWTGPYGSGKSSLVIALSALLSGNRLHQKRASASIGKDTANRVRAALKP